MADIAGDASTTAVINGTGFYHGLLETEGDRDWWRVSLVEGLTYSFFVQSFGVSSTLEIINDSGVVLNQGTQNALRDFTPEASGTFYVNVQNRSLGNNSSGSYNLVVGASDTIGATEATAAAIRVGQDITSGYETVDDVDKFVFNAVAGVTYELTLAATDPSTLLGQWLYLGKDDFSVDFAEAFSLIDGVARLTYIATTTEKLYIGTNAYEEDDIGGYKLTLRSDAREIVGTGANDTLSGMDNDNFIATGAGDDVLNGNGGNDTLRGGEGNDLLNGGAGLDIADYSGGSGPMQVNLSIAGAQNTGWGNDTLVSIEGILGGAGNDRLNGNNLANTLSGAGGNDFIFGAAGDDILLGGYGHDTINGGSGTDTLIFDTPGPAQVDLLLTGTQWTGQGNDLIKEIENVQGNNGNDIFLGSGGDNILQGLGGNDLLAGRAGNDRLNGGDGVDTLRGGTGNDVLTGGNGADVFKFVQGDGTDRILDYAQGVDRIDLQTLTGPTAELIVTQAGADTQVWYGDIRIVLVGVDVTQMGSEDFIFT